MLLKVYIKDGTQIEYHGTRYQVIHHYPHFLLVIKINDKNMIRYTIANNDIAYAVKII